MAAVDIRGKLLSKAHCERIHEASCRLLSQCGVRLDQTAVLRLLHEAGGVVDYDARQIRFPEELIERALSLVPRSLTFAGLTAADDLHLWEACRPLGRPAVGMDAVLDHRRSTVFPASQKHLRDWARLTQALERVHIAAPIYPHDVPASTRDLHALATTLAYTSKPCIICAYSGRNVDHMAHLVNALPRGMTPRIAVVFSADSPLSYSANQLDIAFAAAKHGFPLLINSAALLGATCPVTLWGCLIQMHTEALAAITILQTMQPGAAVVYDMQPLQFDMRTGAAAFGYAELGLLNAAFVELGRSRGLITESSGFKTDSHLVDEQAGREKVATAYLSVLAGANLLSGLGSLSTASVGSLLQLVVDDDLFGQLTHVAQGICTESDDQVEALIGRIGPGGHFLTDDHTIRHFRGEVCMSQLAVRGSHESWVRTGERQSVDFARDRVEAVLKQPEEPLLEGGVVADLELILAEAGQSDGSAPRVVDGFA